MGEGKSLHRILLGLNSVTSTRVDMGEGRVLLKRGGVSPGSKKKGDS